MNVVILLLASLGQYHYEAPQKTATRVIYVSPVTTYHYKLGFMVERTREYRDVKYLDGVTRHVPIINGYVPQVTTQTKANGDINVTYDYRKKIKFSELKK